jgi:putative hydrolase of the HAD superfamily
LPAREEAYVSYKYESVIFDAGGTLIGSDDPIGFERDLAATLGDLGAPTSAEQVRGLMRQLQREVRDRRRHVGGWSRTPEEYRQNMLWVGTFILEKLGVAHGIEDKAAAIYQRFAAGGFIDLFSDVKPTLEGLRRRGISMGVLSNYPPFLERNLQLLGIHHYFSFFVVSSKLGLEKPDPQIFHIALEKAGHPLEQALYVGDSPHDDVEGAKRVGLDVILVDRFDRYPEMACGRIHTLTELLEIPG